MKILNYKILIIFLVGILMFILILDKPVGYGILTSNHIENDVLKYKHTIIGGTTLAISNTGIIYYGINKNLYSSSDGGSTSNLLHTFSDNIQSIYYYNFANVIFVGINNGEIYRKVDKGSTWDLVLKMTNGKYPVWWSWDSDSYKILVGEYGNQSNNSLVYKSTNNGSTWSIFFNLSRYYSITDAGSHIHLVKIDPDNNYRIFINVGDGKSYRGMYTSNDNGKKFKRLTVEYDYDVTSVANGFLAMVNLDDNKSIFFTDNSPTIWGYDKITEEFEKLSVLSNPYYVNRVKFYDAIKGNDDVIYISSVDYNKSDNSSYIWISVDGRTLYRLNNKLLYLEAGNFPLKYNPKDGYIYAGRGVAFKDITRNQAYILLYSYSFEIVAIFGFIMIIGILLYKEYKK